MTANTQFLGSGLTQRFTGSDASFDGQVYFNGAVVALSTLSVVGTATLGAQTVGAITASSISATGKGSFASVVAGGGNGPFAVSTATVAVAEITITGSKSVTTDKAFSGATTTGATTNPVIYLATPSGLSDDVVLTVRPTSTNTVTLYYSNVSTVQAVVAANTVRITKIQF